MEQLATLDQINAKFQQIDEYMAGQDTKIIEVKDAFNGLSQKQRRNMEEFR